MKILCVTHADFETPGVILDWALQHQHEMTISRPYLGENCLEHKVYDFLILMGGPQSPLKQDQYPYLKQEITFIQQAIATNKIILGFCLGAQLIGEALGARTERSPEKEIGVYPIRLTAEGLADPLFQGFPKTFQVIHWHNDMPGEIEDSVVLASSDGCPRQVIRYGRKIYGFQCHLEIPLQGIEAMIAACPEDLKASKFTQSKDVLLQQDYLSIHRLMFQLLDRLVTTRNIETVQ